VLADKDQGQVPSASLKQELREACLGQRRIVFRNKKGDFKHIQEGLYNNFPKLSEAGGFELYRQQDGKEKFMLHKTTSFRIHNPILEIHLWDQISHTLCASNPKKTFNGSRAFR